MSGRSSVGNALRSAENTLRGVPSGLLVSVRSADEARAALAGGASIIDVKEPNRGSLGAAGPAVWCEVAAAVGRAVPLSAALGELTDEDRPDARWLGAEYQFAKLGLSGCVRLPNWQARWEEALACLPKTVARVAVAYADWRAAESPDPMEILDGAIALGCAALLVDTFDKSGGDLFCHLAAGELRQLTSAAREAGLLMVLAGSLSMETLAQALQFSPDFVAVRGAVCRGSRRGQVEEILVREVVAEMKLTIHSSPRQFA